MTVAEALRAAAAQLAETSETARLDAELLMAFALQATRSNMLLQMMDAPTPEWFAQLLARRMKREPIAYITGEQEFFGRSFKVTPDVLIPRSDSETVIDAALAARPHAKRVLDLGTGSGVLLLTFMAETAAKGVGIDRSSEAAEIAADNAQTLGLADRVEIRVADWTKPNWSEGMGRFDLILANPPYVETDAELAPDVVQYEPHGALFAGPEGLDDYALLIPQLSNLLNLDGFVVLEIGSAQALQVSALAERCGFAAQLQLDLEDRPRALVLSRIV